MKSLFSNSLFSILMLACAATLQAHPRSERLARNALSTTKTLATEAVTELRASGPVGLDALFRVYRQEIDAQIIKPNHGLEWQRLSAVLEAVSQQKDSYLSGLYWYTDISQAKKAARASGKPILSLRLLGKLTDEYSCANSRFFRSILYANEEVSNVLRKDFVLHWQSVRPVPRLTIDFGDGRKLETTVTGNSIHYILDAQGQPLDALPGLYGPKAFLRSLGRVQELHKLLKDKSGDARHEALDEYHRSAVRRIKDEWIEAAWQAGVTVIGQLFPRPADDSMPRAVEIAPLAVTKSAVELNILKAITRDTETLGKLTDELAWRRIADQNLRDAKLDGRSVNLIKRQTQSLPSPRTASTARLADVLKKLESSVALDTVRNEFFLHTQLHAWLIADPVRFDVELLNEKVYAELFLTPGSDPWLGLFPESYTALERGGVTP